MTEHFILEEGDAACVEAVLIMREGDQDLLRGFTADIQLDDGETTELRIGSIRGLIGWRIGVESLWDAADGVSDDAEPLGRAGDAIIRWLHDARDIIVDSVVMIRLLRLDPQFRGQRLTRGVIDELVEVLALEPAKSLIMLQPEPLLEDGQPLPDGPERDAALARLRRSYEEQGLERWKETPVWWRLAADIHRQSGRTRYLASR